MLCGGVYLKEDSFYFLGTHVPYLGTVGYNGICTTVWSKMWAAQVYRALKRPEFWIVQYEYNKYNVYLILQYTLLPHSKNLWHLITYILWLQCLTLQIRSQLEFVFRERINLLSEGAKSFSSLIMSTNSTVFWSNGVHNGGYKPGVYNPPQLIDQAFFLYVL